jgi:hypothetical protein
MKKTLVLIMGLILIGMLNADTPTAPDFRAPTFADPYYRIHFPFEVKADKVIVKGLRLNSGDLGQFLLFKEGKNISATTALDRGVYDIVIDYAWSSGRSYEIVLLYQPEASAEPEELELKGTSPRRGGIPGGREGFYRIYRVEEEAGIGRTQELVALTLTAARSDIQDGNFVIFDGNRAIPYEIMEKGESVPPEKVASTHPVTLTYKIALLLDASPREKKWLLVLKGENTAPQAGNISVTGEGLGKTIRTAKLVLELSPQSGQINTLESLEAGVKLYNKAGVIHWNPDVFVPGIAWDHSFDWNPPLVFEDRAGDSYYLNVRKGPLPRIRDVDLEVKYAIEAAAPYFISETCLRFDNDLGVIAVRNDEMVLFKDLFDTLVYRDKNQKIVKRPLLEKEGFPFGLVHIAPEDVGWVGLINTKDNYGFFSLRLNASNGNFELPGEFFHRTGTYFYAPSDGNYVYWVRPLVYTWADFATNNLLAFVPKGSFFYEKNAYGIWRLDKNWPQNLDKLLTRLQNPLRVY